VNTIGKVEREGKVKAHKSFSQGQKMFLGSKEQGIVIKGYVVYPKAFMKVMNFFDHIPKRTPEERRRENPRSTVATGERTSQGGQNDSVQEPRIEMESRGKREKALVIPNSEVKVEICFKNPAHSQRIRYCDDKVKTFLFGMLWTENRINSSKNEKSLREKVPDKVSYH
jgi:hypothetical protein